MASALFPSLSSASMSAPVAENNCNFSTLKYHIYLVKGKLIQLDQIPLSSSKSTMPPWPWDAATCSDDLPSGVAAFKLAPTNKKESLREFSPS